jgi:hypothetical protein
MFSTQTAANQQLLKQRVRVCCKLARKHSNICAAAASALQNPAFQGSRASYLSRLIVLLLFLCAAVYFSIKDANPGLAAHFISSALKHGNSCWVRRFTKLKNSPVFNLPPPTSPCTRRMQAASAVGLSLVTSSACRLDKSAPVAAAAYALVTAAVKDGCSFASAVAASTQFGECSAHFKCGELETCIGLCSWQMVATLASDVHSICLPLLLQYQPPCIVCSPHAFFYGQLNLQYFGSVVCSATSSVHGCRHPQESNTGRAPVTAFVAATIMYFMLGLCI